MSVLKNIEPGRVFEIFEDLTRIPRGSGNMEKVADYCFSFAKSNGLEVIRDEANNVIIKKSASNGYEKSAPVVLQGHLDIVCQKSEERNIDFLTQGLEIYVEGDFIKAKGTSLGADNGIAVAIIMAILENKTLNHPKIEAVFTTDEEIGMIGATKLDASLLSGKRMINIDSEELNVVTVSCAGGSDFKAKLNFGRTEMAGSEVKIQLKGLKGGHSGICINMGRQNANVLMGRLLDFMNKNTSYGLISVNGGDKSNAIPCLCEVLVCAENSQEFILKAEEYLKEIKAEIFAREPDFDFEITKGENKTCYVVESRAKQKIIFGLLCCPNGVVEMSAEIENLVETSLNLGVCATAKEEIIFSFALRSNKKSALEFLGEKLKTFFESINFKTEISGFYPPWEYKENSDIRKIYLETFEEKQGCAPKVEAIHAGLECGVFYDKIPDFDCIAIGPDLYDVHTVNERLSISSTQKVYETVVETLEKCK